ncbi:hypothetical protein KVR01_002197 [Diaporthe batatas]|uniref:uncharacterized protein n=1 Tax=Diaporthe batatas TaxID=748121 RepID=UPI001D049E39|nr:uncharacterized protein KVR01_002197 [Diaporthe batatas]KAG8166508.1 hypothetical protein KVR01_002197 [Diaporthe batatas]
MDCSGSSSSSSSSSSPKAAAPEAASTSPTTMGDLDAYFDRLILKELDHFRAGPSSPANNTINNTTAAPASPDTPATEVAETTASPPVTGQAGPTTPTVQARPAAAVEQAAIHSAPVTAPAPKAAAPPADHPAEDGKATKQVDEPETATRTVATALPAAVAQELRLLTIPNNTPRQRHNNGARTQRVYRLAAKLGVSPGAARWVRGAKAYAQPAIPESTVVSKSVTEYNQFLYDGGDDDDKKVVLRMPGGWKRDLVRSRPAFLGVAVIDGFLWPRFSPNLPRGMTTDWEEQGFVEFNEVRYTTPFVAREPRPAVNTEREDGILIRLDE